MPNTTTLSGATLSYDTGFLTGSKLSDPGSLLNIAVSILKAYGGSLWVANPQYCFQMSDGTGAASDGSDAGYVRDLCATLGPERTTNGDFSNGTAGWSTNGGAALSVINGRLVVSWASGTSNYAGTFCPSATVQAGKTYELDFDLISVVGGKTVQAAIVGFQTIKAVSSAGSYQFVFTAISSGSLGFEYANQSTAAGDNFVLDNVSLREVVGRPLFQATTSFKPKLKRVPKRLGPELVTNGDFSAGAVGWSVAGAGASISVTSGVVTITNGTGEASIVLPSTTSGKSYEVVADITALSGTGAVYFVPPSGSSVSNIPRAGVGQLRGTFVSGGGGCRISVGVATAGASFSIDNISVREVLEWGWAWVFDGADDVLATVSQAAGASETFIVAKRLYALPAGTRTAMSKAGTNTGVELYANASVYNNSQIGTGSAYVYKSAFGTVSSAAHSAVVTPTTRQIRVNGSSAGVEAITFASAPAAIKVGGGTAAFSGEVFAAAYASAAIPDAELLIVERAVGALAGVTT